MTRHICLQDIVNDRGGGGEGADADTEAPPVSTNEIIYHLFH